MVLQLKEDRHENHIAYIPHGEALPRFGKETVVVADANTAREEVELALAEAVSVEGGREMVELPNKVTVVVPLINGSVAEAAVAPEPDPEATPEPDDADELDWASVATAVDSSNIR
jgi:hypothetical protein